MTTSEGVGITAYRLGCNARAMYKINPNYEMTLVMNILIDINATEFSTKLDDSLWI